MAKRAIDAVLCEWYSGEVGGEALFWQFAERAEAAEARKWLLLAEVEALVGARLRDAILARGRDVPSGASGLEWARRVAGRPAATGWPEAMRWLETIARDALKAMTRDAAGLPAELAPLGALVVRHETMLVEFARLERAGEQAAALVQVTGFLARERPG